LTERKALEKTYPAIEKKSKFGKKARACQVIGGRKRETKAAETGVAGKGKLVRENKKESIFFAVAGSPKRKIKHSKIEPARKEGRGKKY